MSSARDSMQTAKERVQRRVGGERRVRSGCWKCRERRVKCPEQRPICNNCRRLGLACGYTLRLTWQEPSCVSQKRYTTHNHTNPDRWSILNVYNWMFLNLSLGDFEDDVSGECESIIDLDPASIQGMHRTVDTFCRTPEILSPSLRPAGISYMNISSKESRLWDYFANFITPQCAVKPAANPYRSVVLRIAAAFPGGPLFQCIMAIAASQMQSLRHGDLEISSCEFREIALKSLRCHLDANQRGLEEAMVAIAMMSFLEILEDCSPSWIIHADFGERLLASHKTMMATSPDLYHFLATWFVVHSVLASTACGLKSGHMDINTQLASVNEDYVQTLTGCSKSLLCLLADITALAGSGGTLSPALGEIELPAGDRTIPIDVKKERDRIERQLCRISPASTADSTLAGNEIHLISELKRLATLMYLYARIDEASPYEPHMARLTEEILEILPHIPLRTNTILWPLFILGTLGVRPESDDHRKIVLQFLDALQKTRQLGCVKKARCVVGNVWKARDLRTMDAMKGWSILKGRHRNISLA